MTAGQSPISAEKSKASLAADQSANNPPSGQPAIGRRPVQFGTAVSRNPPITAPTKPNSISCRCQASGSSAVGSEISPVSEQIHRVERDQRPARSAKEEGAESAAEERMGSGISPSPQGEHLLAAGDSALARHVISHALALPLSMP